MSNVLAKVDRKTQLAGHNRLELLLFQLNDQQEYGINVFKVQEVIQCPKLVTIPNANRIVKGVANLRGQTVTIMDIGAAIGLEPLNDIDTCFIIVTEYNRHTQGFLVNSVDRIINMNWEEIEPPPQGVGLESYLTAVTQLEHTMVQIIDVEKILSEVVPVNNDVSQSMINDASLHIDSDVKPLALIADDSLVAREQVKSAVQQLGLDCITTNNGREAFDLLRKWSAENDPLLSRLALVISDIEMPEMDGYSFTKAIRKEQQLQSLYIILHSSLSGGFNKSMVEKVGANDFIAKFQPDLLAQAIVQRLQTWQDITPA